MSESERAEVISALAGYLDRFMGSDFMPQLDPLPISISQAYDELARQMQQLPQSHQGAPVAALADVIWLLPKEEQVARYLTLHYAALSLPDDQLGIALRHLPASSRALPPDKHHAALRLWENALVRVQPAQRAHAAMGLIESTVNFEINSNNERLGSMWRRALQLLDGAGEQELLRVLITLRQAEIFCIFNDPQWEGALAEIEHFMESNGFTEAVRKRVRTYFPWLRRSPLEDER
jgi:hypothetical protein